LYVLDCQAKLAYASPDFVFIDRREADLKSVGVHPSACVTIQRSDLNASPRSSDSD